MELPFSILNEKQSPGNQGFFDLMGANLFDLIGARASMNMGAGLFDSMGAGDSPIMSAWDPSIRCALGSLDLMGADFVRAAGSHMISV